MSVIGNLTVLNQYSDYLQPSYDKFPHGRYVSLLIVRKTESETIFRTEGSGEGLVKEIVIAGATSENAIPMRRVMISKRKQTAVERRTGRELLREYEMLKMAKVKKEEQICALNTNAPCGKCIDCMLYGYAVGGGGAQKSRVMTDDAFSIGPAAQVTGKRTFNATFDNGTMRNPFTYLPSTSINEDEYVLPETHFLDIETLKDVTVGELQYVIGNILRSSRYGAISSRLGRVRNKIVAIIFSDTEIFSNLELTQNVYDNLMKNSQENKELDFPLVEKQVLEAVHEATKALLSHVVGRMPTLLHGDVLQQVLDETITLYRNTNDVKSFLVEIDRDYSLNGK
ncbi:MAG: type I-D CRISPR-associated protein Cas7/Csc2 [Ktedonobacteraceae bacterium]